MPAIKSGHRQAHGEGGGGEIKSKTRRPSLREKVATFCSVTNATTIYGTIEKLSRMSHNHIVEAVGLPSRVGFEAAAFAHKALRRRCCRRTSSSASLVQGKPGLCHVDFSNRKSSFLLACFRSATAKTLTSVFSFSLKHVGPVFLGPLVWREHMSRTDLHQMEHNCCWTAGS